MDQFLKIDITTLAVFGFVLFPLWNSFLINWDKAPTDKRKKWSRLWHGTGVAGRVLFGIIIIRTNDPTWFSFSLIGFLSYPVWNWAINYGMKIKPPQILFYIGKTAVTDKIMRKHKRIVYLIYLLTIINLILSIILK